METFLVFFNDCFMFEGTYDQCVWFIDEYPDQRLAEDMFINSKEDYLSSDTEVPTLTSSEVLSIINSELNETLPQSDDDIF